MIRDLATAVCTQCVLNMLETPLDYTPPLTQGRADGGGFRSWKTDRGGGTAVAAGLVAAVVF